MQNCDGETDKIIRTIETAGIYIRRFDITASSGHSTLRLTVSDAKRAVDMLRHKGYEVDIYQVVCIKCAGTPGAVSDILARLARERIAVEYVHAFSQGYTADILIRPDDTDKCERMFSYEHGPRPGDEPAAIFRY